MEKWKGKVVLVTGASSGVGRAVATSLVKEGMKVVGCGRDVERIETLKKKLEGEIGEILPVRCDLQSEEQILSMFSEIKEKWKGVDVCVNNAGVGKIAPLTTGSTADWKLLLDVNVLAVAICTRETIKSIRERNLDSGHIINIGSVAGHNAMAGNSIYNVCKFGITAMTESLRLELSAEKSKIRVSQISPGLLNTEFGERMTSVEAQKEFLASFPYITAEDVAESLLYLLKVPMNVQVHDIIVRAVNGHV